MCSSRFSGKMVTMLTLVFGALLTVAPTGFILGQGTTAQINGRILDSSGAVVTGAKIVVKNLGTQGLARTVSNSDGLYTIPQLSPGHYDISVDKQGFAMAVRSAVTLNVDQAAEIDFSLKVGAATETVEVTGSRPFLRPPIPPPGRLSERSKSRVSP